MTNYESGPGADEAGPESGVRLQAVLARAGVASRRAAEQLIAAGRVAVDGVVVTRLGTKVDAGAVTVTVDGDLVEVDPNRVHLAVNKPRGMVSTMSDPDGRWCLADLVGERPERLFHVGRLDADSEGLLLLTNDGDLAHRLMHPSFGVTKTYLAEIPAPVRRDLGRLLREGVQLDDGPVRVDRYRLVASHGQLAQIHVELHEGRNHIVRRMLAATGNPVSRLVRTQIGPVRLGDLRAGAVRPLTRQELAGLRAATLGNRTVPGGP